MTRHVARVPLVLPEAPPLELLGLERWLKEAGSSLPNDASTREPLGRG